MVLTRVESPKTFAVVMTKRCPVRSMTGLLPASGPVRIFGPCKIGENGDWFFLFDGGGTQRGDILRVLGVRAMRKIQAGDIHAGFQQTADHARRAAGRPDGANDF